MRLKNVTFYCNVDKDALEVVDFYRQDIEALKKLGYSVKICTRWREIKFKWSDIIFVWWWTYALVPTIIAKILSKKVVITGTFNFKFPQSFGGRDYFGRPFYERFLISTSLKLADQNMLVSKYEYDRIKEFWPNSNISYYPHVINTEKNIPSKSKMKSEFLFTMMWTGSKNIERKRFNDIIELGRIIKDREDNLKIIVAGRKGDAFDRLSNDILQEKLDEIILLKGEITEEDRIKYMQNCLCYFQPTNYEGFGLAIAEAMSCGAVVMSHPRGEVPNLIGNSGILLDSYDSKMYYDKIQEIRNGKYKSLGKMARERIESHFSENTKATMLNDIFSKL